MLQKEATKLEENDEFSKAIEIYRKILDMAEPDSEWIREISSILKRLQGGREAASNRRTQKIIDKTKDSDPPSLDDKIFEYLNNLAKEEGMKFQHHESALAGLNNLWE